MIYKYFVHHRMNRNGKEQLVTEEIDMNKKIKNMNHIRMIEDDLIKRNKADSLIITNYILMSKRFGRISKEEVKR